MMKWVQVISSMLPVKMPGNKQKQFLCYQIPNWNMLEYADVAIFYILRTSYYYINAAPQWQSFNNGNWKELELDTRNTAAARNADWDVYTGTYDILTLADVNGKQQPIYLAKDANNNNVIPAPKYYWKVVHDKAANKATAFIGINNPHLASVSFL